MLFHALMENTPTSRRPLSDLWPWLVVVLILLLTTFIRFRLLDVPLERDEGEYAYAGQLLLQGIPPYQLAWNMKLPGTYFAYALGMALFGQTTAGIHATLIVANCLTTVFIFLLARKLFGIAAGLAACATFGILSASPAVMGLAAHANHFVILFAVPATLLLWKAEESKQTGTLFWSGLLYGLAFLMKQQGICFCLFAVAVVFWNALENKTLLSAGFVGRILLLGGAMLLPFVLTCLYLWQAGVFAKFWFWTFTYAGKYATEVSLHEGVAKLSIYVHKKWIVYIAYIAFIALSLPFMALNRALRKQILFVAAFLAFSFLGTTIDFNFREHYFILLLPSLAMFTGLAMVLLQRTGNSPVLKFIAPICCVLILGFTVFLHRGFFFQMPANTVSVMVYYGDAPFTAMPGVGAYIRAHSATNATVAVFGSEPEIYFYAQRHSATGYLYMYPLMEPQPYALQMQREMTQEIEAKAPDFLVYVPGADSWNVRPESDQTILHWFYKFSKQYQAVASFGPTADNGNHMVQMQSPPVTVFQREMPPH
jgi:4-amino-4-deoxy-L-arabinose transferase-like glycosyltransferase